MFKAQGLDVTIQNFGASGAKALQSLIGGSSDVVVGFYDHTVQMQAEGQDVRCVILLNKNPGIALAVRDDLAATIKDAKDLKGKNIGVTGPGSSTDFLLRYLLVRAGVKPEDVSIIGVGSGASAVAAMERKSIDAVMNYDPAITMLERRKLAHVMVDGRTSEGSRQAFGGPYPASCLYSTGAFIAKNPVTIQRLVNAFAQALTFIDKTPAAEIAAALPPEYGLGDPGLFAEVIGHSKPMFPAVGTFESEGPRARQGSAERVQRESPRRENPAGGTPTRTGSWRARRTSWWTCRRLEQSDCSAPTGLLEGRKLVQGIDHRRHEIVSAAMSGVVENLQSAGGPSLGQPPGGHQWCADIEASIDEHARDAVQLRGVPDQLVLLEKRGVPPIVSHEASEPQTKLGILVARIWSVTRARETWASSQAHHSRAARSRAIGSGPASIRA